jgi:hypothetical protein
MITYRISRRDLEDLIETEKRGWLTRAGDRTEEFRRLGYYKEKSSIWSEVKPVYMRLQGSCKCAYCERKLESTDYGKGEQDVEHFRPKGGVKAWRMPKALKESGITPTKVPKDFKGYYLLPYHPFNYSASCKPCNSALKKDYFPIAGTYDCEGESPQNLLKEDPFLIYPIGDFDDNPEDLISFHGTSPQPLAADGHARERALVTIEFFKLDDANKRKNLFRERAIIIVALFTLLEKQSKSPNEEERNRALNVINGFLGSHAPHTNCARSFKRLYEVDPVEAEAVFESASQLICSIS